MKRFIYLKNKPEALKILNQIATINKKPLLSLEMLEERDEEHMKNKLDKRKYTIMDLFRYKSLCVPTVILIFAHFFVEMFYWGTGFALPSLGTSMYLNIFLFGLIEMISYLAAEICIRKCRRRVSFILIGALSTILCFIFYFLKVPDDCTDMCAVKIIKTILVMLARGLVCLSLTIMYVYFSEIFPTSVKAIGILITYASGAIGSLSASYVVDYSETLGLPPLVLLGIMVAVQTVICIFLKETFGVVREEQIEELKSKANSFCEKQILDEKLSA